MPGALVLCGHRPAVVLTRGHAGKPAPTPRQLRASDPATLHQPCAPAMLSRDSRAMQSTGESWARSLHGGAAASPSEVWWLGTGLANGPSRACLRLIIHARCRPDSTKMPMKMR